MRKKKTVCVIGSGNWGTTVAKIVAENVAKLTNFEERVPMYVYTEMVNGRLLSDIINEKHENIKYLPNHKLPENIVAMSDVVETAKDADIIIFVVPHQFTRTLCSALLGKIKPTANALSFIKGFEQKPSGNIELISHVITRHLRIQCAVIMGANMAGEVADGKFCETTIGCRDSRLAPILRSILETEYVKVIIIDDQEAVEMCGALRSIVSCGAGFVDGLGLGINTKSAVIRYGLMEMIKFVDIFYPGCKLSTFFESCGLADLTACCYGGRNRRVCEAFVKTKKPMKKLEEELLKGQLLQGPFIADIVNTMLKNKGMENKFPLFTTVHNICCGELPPEEIINCIKNNPEHVYVPISISFQ